MRNVAQLAPILNPYLARGQQSSATNLLAMLNAVLPRLYFLGDWKSLKTRWTVNVQSGYFCLPPEYECVLSASLWNVPMTINSIDYETRRGGPGEITRPASAAFGLIDQGLVPLMSEIASTGAAEFIFTSETNATFAVSAQVTVTYDDTVDGYTQVTLPLNTKTAAISAAATYASGDETLLTVASSAYFAVNGGVTITGAADTTYNANWRVTAVPDSTHIAINKTYVAGAISATASTNRRIQPANGISNVQPMSYQNLPSRVTVTDSDDIQYAILCAGDGMAQFRRYEVVQVPETPNNPDDWNVIAVVKRAYTPLVSMSDMVYLDNIPALTDAFLAVVYRDASNHQQEAAMWESARKNLDQELYNNTGGVIQYPTIEPFGLGMPPIGGGDGGYRYGGFGYYGGY